MTDDERQTRIGALLAAAYLYVPNGGYLETIEEVNELLDARTAAPKYVRYYRACAFGQLYRAFRDTTPTSLTDDDKKEIADRIESDTRIALSVGVSPEKFSAVVNPSRDRPDDDDLQAFAADHPAYATDVLGLPAAPGQPQDRKDKPVAVPLPGGKKPGELAKGCRP
jgi:hypothetical protein